jgi:hypothetical protein
MADVDTRFQNALNNPKPDDELYTLAVAFKGEGMKQLEMYELFERYRAQHHDHADETKYNAILDVMDFIVGWCSPHARIFDTDLDI